MDFCDLDTVKACDEGVEYDLLHPVTGEPTGAILKLRGSDATGYKDELERQRDAMVRKKSLAAAMTRSERESREIALLRTCVVGWKNLQLGGKDLEFSPENVEMLLVKYPWFRSQVDTAAHDMSLFLKP